MICACSSRACFSSSVASSDFVTGFLAAECAACRGGGGVVAGAAGGFCCAGCWSCATAGVDKNAATIAPARSCEKLFIPFAILPFRERIRRNTAGAFFHGDDLVCTDVFQRVDLSARPMN